MQQTRKREANSVEVAWNARKRKGMAEKKQYFSSSVFSLLPMISLMPTEMRSFQLELSLPWHQLKDEYHYIS